MDKEKLLGRLIEDYRQSRPKSAAFFTEACRRVPWPAAGM